MVLSHYSLSHFCWFILLRVFGKRCCLYSGMGKYFLLFRTRWDTIARCVNRFELCTNHQFLVLCTQERCWCIFVTSPGMHWKFDRKMTAMTCFSLIAMPEFRRATADWKRMGWVHITEDSRFTKQYLSLEGLSMTFTTNGKMKFPFC